MLFGSDRVSSTAFKVHVQHMAGDWNGCRFVMIYMPYKLICLDAGAIHFCPAVFITFRRRTKSLLHHCQPAARVEQTNHSGTAVQHFHCAIVYDMATCKHFLQWPKSL